MFHLSIKKELHSETMPKLVAKIHRREINLIRPPPSTLNRDAIQPGTGRGDDENENESLQKRQIAYRRLLRELEDDQYLVVLCQKLEWKQVAKSLKALKRMLDLLIRHDDDTDQRLDVSQKIRRQLAATDSRGNNVLHLMSFLVPPSDRIPRLLLDVARQLDDRDDFSSSLKRMCAHRNEQGLTPFVVSCSSRNGRPLNKILLKYGDFSLKTLLTCDFDGKSPFTALIQGYHVFSKIPAMMGYYRDLTSIDSVSLPCATSTLCGTPSMEPFCETWEEARYGCFPLLWKSCQELIDAAWHSAFPESSRCPSMLHGAALVAPALPTILTDIIFRSCRPEADRNGDASTITQTEELYSLLQLTIIGTRATLESPSSLSSLQRSIVDHQSLHFVQRVLRLAALTRDLSRDASMELGTIFCDAIMAGLSWNVYDDSDEMVSRRCATAFCDPMGSCCWSATNKTTGRAHPHRAGIGWLQALAAYCPNVLREADPSSGLFPFQLAAAATTTTTTTKTHNGLNASLPPSSNNDLDRIQLDTIYNLLQTCPDVLIANS